MDSMQRGTAYGKYQGYLNLTRGPHGALQTVVLRGLQRVRRIEMYVYSMKFYVMQTFDGLAFRS